ncbi:T9SS C-terminal target domain-containing protein [candidate division KSB1 bacterium]|nr:MAG: T9SS C-terminal target domain-containing protein [candidate division KSB1 bacterium]
MGDFNGDGRDEFLDHTDSGLFLVARQPDTSRFLWTVGLGGPKLIPQYHDLIGCFAMDLDGDGADELLVYTSNHTTACHVWKAASFDPPYFEPHDELLSSIFFPQGTHKAAFGDWDGDGRMNAFFVSPVSGNIWNAALWERQINGNWLREQTLDSVFSGDFCADDLDGDGDADLAAFYYSRPDSRLKSLVIENLGGGSSRQRGCPMPGPYGGDFNGDGKWEGLFEYQGMQPYLYAELRSDSGCFLSVIEHKNLSPVHGPFIGNLKTRDGYAVASIMNFTLPWPDLPQTYFNTVIQTPDGWVTLPAGPAAGGWLCDRVSFADYDGDGLRDLLTHLKQPGNQSAGNGSYYLWKNVGTAEADSFSFSPESCTRLDRFSSDIAGSTNCLSLEIGDITGDGRAELAGVFVQNNRCEIRFFTSSGSIADTTITAMTAMCTGLPTSPSNLRLTDINGDGRAELFYKSVVDLWRVFYFENESWRDFGSILPVVGESDIGFADVNGDGTIDLITPFRIWLNLHYSSADDPFILHPSSFALSAFPNPFNGALRIEYNLPRAENVAITVYNVMGQKVADIASGFRSAGNYSAQWIPNTGSGIYYIHLTSQSQTRIQKVAYIR